MAALLVHGYHPFAEDAEIYLPTVEKALDPQLFPADAAFFAPYARWSIFARVVAASVQLTHLRLETVLFGWHLLSIFLFLLACRRLAALCFEKEAARWAAVGPVAALLTLPVAGTALYLMSQYVDPRNFVAFAGIFAVADWLEGKRLRAALWMALGLAMHPLMGSFVVFFCLLLSVPRKRIASLAACVVPFASFPSVVSPAYHEAARYHSFHYVMRWHWYEWLGIFAPLLLLALLSRIAKSQGRVQIERICRALLVFGGLCFVAALVTSIPARLEEYARFQPLRGLHLLYIILFLVIGGFLGEYVLQRQWWRWLVLFVPLCIGMFLAQRALFPASSHIEWPGATPSNPWAQAFLWVRDNTSVDAKFALGPLYLQSPGEDNLGFRALAQRSRLADALKDSGEASMFPSLAEEWWRQVQAQQGWQNFTAADFVRLRSQFNVGWVVLTVPPPAGMQCPYRNGTVTVCRLD